jgi:cell division protein FtsI/penicillin-binding protein 2
VERVGSARLRVVALLLVALVLAGMVWSRLAYWQVLQHGRLTMEAQAQYREFVQLPAMRGAIFDRNLTQLVVNTTVYSAFVSPDQVAAADRDRVATGLA